MTREQWQNVRKILERALELDPAECTSYLDEACAGDAELRREVESLLAANDAATGAFLAGKAIDQVGGFERASSYALKGDALEGRRIGPYLVIEEIGHGGMGTVYRAVRADDQYQQQVAIKVVRGGLSDRLAIQRFKAERQILANLDHANIARLLDGGATEDGRPYVVMEYIEGVAMDQYANAHQLSLRARLNLFRTVCSAVAFAHQRLVIHRDIKPANILVTGSGEPKLLDFGIAKILDDEQAGEGAEVTVTMVRLMTPEYASPEQMRGEPVTTATDVYSLGVVLYILLTGQKPYRVTSRNTHELVQAVLETVPEKPSTSNRRLRGDLDNIVLRALRKEPERRYASVEQFSEDIRRHLEGLPVSARPDTLAYRGSKFVRRHKWAVLAAGLAVLALLGGMVATLREAYIAENESKRAERRFNDTRQLANSLLFEVYDAIENLPGATPARKILVDRALQYLDKLANEAKGGLSLQNDLALQRELATAYERVGDVQGGFRSSNLGDTAGFITSYRKALAIRESVLRGDPANAQSQRELFQTHLRLSDALMATGNLKDAVGQVKEMLPIAEKLAADDPNNLANRRNLASAYLDYGWKRSGLGDWKDGLGECRKATAMLESIVATDPSDKRTRRILAIAYERVAELLSTYEERHAESLAMEQKALAVEEQLLRQAPRNTDLERLKAWDTMRVGEEILAGGDLARGLEKYGDALDQFQFLSDADPKSVQFHNDVAAVLGRIGAAHLTQGKPNLAVADFERSLAQIDSVSRTGALDIDALEIKAQDQFRLAGAYERSGQRRQAALWFERSIPSLKLACDRNGPRSADEASMLAEARGKVAAIR
jgi:tetratricopeptide (TPR) repeat protein/tRNA A-37 threonylcarbamoyl transferase component Bud32